MLIPVVTTYFIFSGFDMLSSLLPHRLSLYSIPLKQYEPSSLVKARLHSTKRNTYWKYSEDNVFLIAHYIFLLNTCMHPIASKIPSTSFM